MSDIASVSLERSLEDMADELGQSFGEYGFAIVRNHGISAELIDRAWKKCEQFFALPEDVKRSYFLAGKGGARGYTPFGTERAKDAKINDLKEFWHVGRTLPAGDPLEEFMPPNVWPAEIDGFQETFEELYQAFENTGKRILSAIALHLGLEEDFFDPTIENGNSVMRLLHYPPVAEGNEGAIRAAAHEDINTITLLLGAEESGLELLSREGKWIAVKPSEGALAVNIGDMLQRLTNGKMRSTTHRVVNPVGDAAKRSRYSMPFFLHFRPDYMIEPLESCFDPENPEKREEPISSHDYLMQRLREINLV
ncbi:isopenicillin N synthase family oxygenase [Altererythrobacter indicus]|uniref:2-oxoglutarate-dependent ethylene/succinate-forming enzyme n=1 Tax=Altericroceibacterium indicum TaxID=374177 RepID=A0A845A409_9SPHN|nr:isopenicillin N synthase family oxygenase [Altericroceibacterium indicum]MXP25012.1 isopenicillin N synthase family oxygenase [Altericroceibacterium indicum]